MADMIANGGTHSVRSAWPSEGSELPYEGHSLETLPNGPRSMAVVIYLLEELATRVTRVTRGWPTARESG
eukprot:225674-Pelagomonas_calceolata.AAC.1